MKKKEYQNVIHSMALERERLQEMLYMLVVDQFEESCLYTEEHIDEYMALQHQTMESFTNDELINELLGRARLI